MAAEDAGTIEAKIVLKLSELKKDVMEAVKSLDNLTTELKKTEKTAEDTGKNSEKAVKQLASGYEKNLKNIEGALKANVLDEKEAAAARLKAGEDYIVGLIKQRTELEKDAEANAKRIEEIDKLIAKQKELNGVLKNQPDMKRYVDGAGQFYDELNGRLAKFVSAAGALPGNMGGVAAKIAKAFSKPIFQMIPAVQAAFQAMLPIIGAILVAVAALAAAISSAARRQKEFSDNVKLAEKASDSLKGKTAELNAEQKKGAEIMERQSLNSAVMRVAFQKLGDFFTDVFLPIANAVKDAFAAIGDAVTWVADKLGLVSAEEAAAARDAQRLAGQNAALVESCDAYETRLKEIAAAEKSRAKTEREIAESRLAAAESYLDELVKRRAATAALAGEESKEAAALDEKIRLQAIERDNYKNTAESVNALEEYRKKIWEIAALKEEKMLKGKKLAEERAGAMEEYLRRLAEQEAAIMSLGARATRADEKRLEGIRAEITAQKAALQMEKDNIAAFEEAEENERKRKEEEENRVNLLTQAEERYNKTLAQIKNQKDAEYISDLEADRRRLEAANQYIEALSGIKDAYHELGSEAETQEAAIRALEAGQIANAAAIKREIAYQESLNQSAEEYKAALGDLEKEYKTILSDAQERAILEDEALSDYERQVALLEYQRQAAIDELEARYAALEARREERGLTKQEIEERDKLTAAINRNFDAMIDGVKKVEDETKGETLAQRIIGHDAYKIGAAAVSAVMDVASALMDVLQEQARKASAEVDRTLKENQEKIEDMRRDALEAAGFAEAKEAESMRERIDRAREAGDQALEYQLKRRQEEMRINEEYDALAKAEEEKAEREKAEIEYKAAMRKHNLDVSNAIVGAAQAVVMAWAQGGAISGLIFAGITAAATAAQIGIMIKNPPQKFESGGIVPGQNYSGDKTLALVNSGELILNKAQQDNVAGRLAGGGATHLTIVLRVDGRQTAQAVFDVAGDGLVDMPIRLLRR